MDVSYRNRENSVEMRDANDMRTDRPGHTTLVNNSGQTIHDDLKYEPTGWFETSMSRLGDSTSQLFKKNRRIIRATLVVLLNAAVLAFFLASLMYYINHEIEPLELCFGFGSLIALLIIIYFFVIYFLLVKRFFGKWFERVVWRKVEDFAGFVWKFMILRICLIAAILIAIGLFLFFDARGNPERLVSLLGLLVLLLLGFLFSAHPTRVNWRTVFIALLLQFIFGLLFIRWDAGRMALQCFSDKVATFLSYGTDGAAFVFGDLLVREENVFAFSSLPVIFFFSMLVEVLFFWGALQWFCLKLGHLLRAATATTVCESVISVGNVFLGMTESVLMIKPYIAVLTESEIHVVMASGFATVSGTILATYISFGAEPAHLVTASVMSAPAAICYAKLLLPETRKSMTAVDSIQPVQSEDRSALSAATRGATNGISLILNIIANLVAFIAVIAFVNGVLGYSGRLVGVLEDEDLNLEWIFGKIFIPFAWLMVIKNRYVRFVTIYNGRHKAKYTLTKCIYITLAFGPGFARVDYRIVPHVFMIAFICGDVIGVPWEECESVGTLIGLKTVVNEFVAYQRMGEMKADHLLSARAELIATYALCGFTNPASAGIMIGALAAMAPNQRETLSKVAVRAFFAGCGICFMTACIAALLMPEHSFGA